VAGSANVPAIVRRELLAASRGFARVQPEASY